MHGNKSQAQREKALARFEAGGVATLVATDVAARGIDVDGISHVINFDPPDDHDAYTHRVGRTGRAGRTGVGITFVGVRRGPRREPHRCRTGPAARVRGLGPAPGAVFAVAGRQPPAVAQGERPPAGTGQGPAGPSPARQVTRGVPAAMSDRKL